MSDPQIQSQPGGPYQPVPDKTPTWEVLMKDPYFGHWYPIWIQNAMENYPIIRADYEKKDRCLTAHPRPMTRPILIIGRGPSADKVGPLLKKWQHPIMATFTNAMFPVANGVEPDYICAFDSFLGMERMKHHNWNKSILLTHPNVDPRVIKGWKWEKMYYRRMFPGQEFFENTFPLMYPMIRIGIRFTGSVVNNAISIANFLGFSPVFLVGCDLSWKDHKATSAANYQFKPDGSLYVSDTQPFEGDPKSIFKIDDLYTDEKMISFKEGLYHIWASDNAQIIDCSDGFLKEMPQANIEDVIKNQGRGFNNILKPQKEVFDIVNGYIVWARKFMDEQKANGYVSPEQ